MKIFLLTFLFNFKYEYLGHCQINKRISYLSCERDDEDEEEEEKIA